MEEDYRNRIENNNDVIDSLRQEIDEQQFSLTDRKKLNADFYTDLDINKDVLMDRNTEVSRLKNELMMLQDVNK
jgi:hypothetical protein